MPEENDSKGIRVLLVDDDGDQVTDEANNAIRVNVVTGAGGTSMTDDAAFTVATSSVTPMGALVDETATDSADEGDIGAPRMTADRKLLVRIVGATDGNRADVDAGGQLQVDVVGALPAGTANIGDVDVLTVPAPLNVTGGGVELGALRVTLANDSTGLVSVDDNAGSLTVDGTITANAGTGTFTVDSELPAAAALADAASAAPSTPTVGTVPLLMNATTVDRARAVVNALDSVGTGIAAVGLVGQLDDTTPSAVTENQFAVARISTRRALLMEGVASGTNVNVAVNAALPAGANNIGDVDILTIAAGDNNIGNVDIVTMPNVTLAAGTNTNEVVGDVAHDDVAAGNPVLVAGISQNMDNTAPPNRVSAEGDTVRLATDRDGTIFAHPHGPQIWSYHENSSSALTDASVQAAPGVGLSLYVTDIVCSTGAATALNVFLEEGATTVLGPWYLEAVAGRGLAIHFLTPKKITANTALTITTSAAIAHGIDITGFIGAG